jgi:hypothetical protein
MTVWRDVMIEMLEMLVPAQSSGRTRRRSRLDHVIVRMAGRESNVTGDLSNVL